MHPEQEALKSKHFNITKLIFTYDTCHIEVLKEMTELLNELAYKKEKLKELLLELHKGKDVNELKTKFKDLLRSINPLEIPLIEQELVREGVSPLEIVKMCDIHVELFREAVETKGKLGKLIPGHPLHTFVEENTRIIRDAEALSLYANSLTKVENEKQKESLLTSLTMLVNQLRGVSKHYEREQMLVYPYLERRGITAVPTVLWRKQDEIIIQIRMLQRILSQKQDDWTRFVEKVSKKATEVAGLLVDMTFRENNILYPTLKELLSDGEWVAIKNQEKDIGFYMVTPGSEWKSSAKPILPFEIKEEITKEQAERMPKEVKAILTSQKSKLDKTPFYREGDIKIENGSLSLEELNVLFKYLPVDVTFIDKDDRVRFFSHGPDRIFVRTPSVLGRPVQQCHPPKSVGIVNKILKAFKEGKRDVADFWVTIGGRFIYIKYVPVRNAKGEYIGTLEITQDLTDLRALQGQKRLLDWK